MKYIFLTLHFILFTLIVSGQYNDPGMQIQKGFQTAENIKVPRGDTKSNPSVLRDNNLADSRFLFGDKDDRFTTLLGGYASAEGEAGLHLEVARVYQPRSFGFGAFSSFIRIPGVNYSNWTITGLQLRAGAANGEIKPYGVFDFGMFNLTYADEKVTLRTATVDLGGGIEKSIGEKTSLLLDFRWKRFFDYKSERDAFTIWTINAGIKF